MKTKKGLKPSNAARGFSSGKQADSNSLKEIPVQRKVFTIMAEGKQSPKHFHSSMWTAKIDLQILRNNIEKLLVSTQPRFHNMI